MKRYKKIITTTLLFSSLLGQLSVLAQETDTVSVYEVDKSSIIVSSETLEVDTSNTDPALTETSLDDTPEELQEESRLNTDANALVEEAEHPSMIFDGDNRRLVTNTTIHPYRQVVIIFIYHKGNYVGRGSGVLIAPNKVLTAAHVLRDVKTNQSYDYVAVAPAQSGTYQPYGQILGSTYHFFTNFVRETSDGYSGAKFYDDLAVVTLNSSFSNIGQLSVVDSLTKDQQLMVIGYPGDKDKYMYESPGSALDMNEKIVMYRNDTKPGNSGGPILDNQNRIVAINIAEPLVDSPADYDYAQKYGSNYGRRINSEALSLIRSAQNNGKPEAGITQSVPIYRLYNEEVRYHFYTRDEREKNALSSRGWRYEGVSFRVDVVGKPVYRLYHAGLRKHLYTASEHEKNTLSKKGWKYEGVAWYSSGAGKLYRLYHPGLKTHMYTTDENEKNVNSRNGWNYEGVAWNVE